tara:strand:- start:118 stop:540 length:423 start_codon:yes stop_codon:yes gene_type:complete
MRNFRNNYRRNKYKNHSDRNNQKNDNGAKIINNLQNGSNYFRKNLGRNGHNASKLIEKYSSLAREALSNGDKILSENYYQHAEHFIRVQSDKDNYLNKNQNLKNVEKIQDDLVQSKDDQKQKEINNIELDPTSQTVTTEG